MDLESCSSSLCSTHYSTPKKPLWFFVTVQITITFEKVLVGGQEGAKNEFPLCVTLTDVDP